MSLIFLTLVALLSLASAFQQGSKSQDAAAGLAVQIPEFEVGDNFVRHSLSDSFQQTLELIKNAESLPSCAKIATSALMHSCSALEGSIPHDDSELARGSDLFVDEEATIYAARLAVCELSGADFLIPKECQAFIPSERATKKRGLRGYWSKSGPTEPSTAFQYYDTITQANLQQCRKALGSSAQSWTSYSNNRQNAVVMCQAMRSEVEKDEHLHISKILTEAAAATTGSLQDALDQANEMKARFSELATAMPRFQEELAIGNERQLEQVRQFWTEIERIHGGLQDIMDGFAGVNEEVHNAKEDAADLGDLIRKAATDSAARFSDVAAAGSKEMGQLSDNVAELNDVTQYIREMVSQGIIQALWNATQDLDGINALIPKLHEAATKRDEAEQRMHQDNMRAQFEFQAIQNLTLKDLMQLGDEAKKLNASVSSIHGLVNAGLPLYVLRTVAKFVGYAILYTLLSFGVWERWVGFRFFGTVAAAMATGLGLAYVSTFIFSPLDLCRTVLTSAADLVFDYNLALGIMLGALMAFVIVATWSALVA